MPDNFNHGDIVTPVRDIWQEADECHPLTLLASKGERLIVDHLRPGKNFDVALRHEYREPGDCFLAASDEVRALENDDG